MEDDDDFGDLYSDIIPPFQSSSSDLNNPNPNPNSTHITNPENSNHLNFNLKQDKIDQSINPNPNFISQITPRVSEIPINSDNTTPSSIRLNLNLTDIKKDSSFSVKKETEEDFHQFDIEENIGGQIGNLNELGGPIGNLIEVGGQIGNLNEVGGANGNINEVEGNNWESDSEDDLQIVLDDDKNGNEMMMMMMMMNGVDEEMGDGNIGIVEGQIEDDHLQGDLENKEPDNIKIPYHPYHSQFKYVRPGAAPIPSGSPVGPTGAPGQVRPIGVVGGRGRGDWRPPGMKGFHPGYAWGNNSIGRGFGIGLDFTLPSHKTIFEVDVESFEEKPWKLSGVDVSDFFNFGMNEESWKDYCKQLELLRMGTSMHGKIRVYESGRTEQEYDPDLPPELAAATGNKDILSENANAGKNDAGQSDSAKEFGNIRPTLPTGRPIMVETGSGERLPSMDTRPPRMRDSDAIIEIVLEGLENDDTQDEAIEQPEHGISREGSGGGHQSEENFVEENNVRLEGDRHPYNGKKSNDRTEGDDTKPVVQEVRTRPSPDSLMRSSSYQDEDVGPAHEERRTKSRTRDRSPNITRSGSTLEKREPGRRKEGSVESVGGKRSSHISSPIIGGSDEDLDVHVDDSHDDLSRVKKERVSDNSPPTEAFVDENPPTSLKRQRESSRAHHSSAQYLDDGGESRAVRSLENRKARSGCERDHQRTRGSVEEEVIRHGRPKIPVNVKRSFDDDEHLSKPRGYDERHEMGKHRLVETSREDPYSYRDWDPHGRKERDNPRKRPLVEEMGARHRNKVHESERTDKDEYFKFKKHMDNGNSRAYYDKDMGSQYRRRDDNMKNRFEAIDDPYRKRRKEDEYMRRDAEKEEMYLGQRDYNNHRKRERDDAVDPRKREGQLRNRDDCHNSGRYKEDDWVLWERERHKAKQSHEENLSKRDRVDGRDGVRSSRTIEDKGWVGQPRVKDKEFERDSQFKDIGRQSEQPNRRDNRVEDATLLHQKGSEDCYVRGDQLPSDERRSKHDRASTRSDLENSRTHHRKHKEHSRKGKESEGGDHESMVSSKRIQEDRNGQLKEPSKGTNERGKGDNMPRKHKENATTFSDEEQQDSRKGRSKLERWTSHTERDFAITSKKLPSSLLAVKETEKFDHISEPVLVTKSPDENHHPLGDPKESFNLENKSAEPKPVEDNNKHLDTVEKLKKRSERFKLPMPSEKEAVMIKKTENEAMPSSQDDALPAMEIKPERPARKRRWISS